MARTNSDQLHGTLDMLVLKAVQQRARMHGYAIAASARAALPRRAAASRKGRSIPRSTAWKRAAGSRPSGPSPTRAGARRFYKLTRPGPCAARGRDCELDAPDDRCPERAQQLTPCGSFDTCIAIVRTPFRRDGIADEIREEMRFHLEMREQELRDRGLTAGAAKRAASERFGDLAVMQDRGYRIRGGGIMESVMQDVRYAGRMIARQPRFTAIVILTIALAMGVSTSLFSIADATLLRPLPFPDPEQHRGGRNADPV